jgi:tetratricopeptide (TPR) repeat protein
MRRRGKRLEVSTFPFLAVLLCAMGSLILVLIIMDRKAKIAARYKAVEAQAQADAESAKLAAALREALEQREKDARAAWDQKRDALHADALSQQHLLQAQIKKVQDQLTDAAARLKSELNQSGELQKRMADARTQLANEDQALAATREALAQTSAQTAAERSAQAKMTADLLQLEAALKDLKEARERDRQTFSVVPYNGKYGGNHRPFYIECTNRGVIFHPERVTVPVALDPAAARGEVERRIAQQKEYLASIKANTDGKPYLLLLVRPDGISSYYQMQSAVRGLDLEFGYEFVDANWILDFSKTEEGRGQLANAAKSNSGEPAANGPGGTKLGTFVADAGGAPGQPQGGPTGTATPGGVFPVVPGGPGGGVGSGSGGAAGGVRPPVPDGPDIGSPTALPWMPPTTGTGRKPRPGGSTATDFATQGEHGGAPTGNGAGTGQGIMPGTAANQGAPSSPTGNGNGTAQGGIPTIPTAVGVPSAPGGNGNATSQGANPTTPTGAVAPSSPAGSGGSASQGANPTTPTGAGAAGSPGAGGNAQPGSGDAPLNPGEKPERDDTPRLAPLPPSRKQPPPLRVARLTGGDRDYIIFIECRADDVVLYPSRRLFTAQSFAHGSPALLQAVQQMIERKQALVRPGELPYRPQIRYLVHQESIRTYHTVYPCLDALDVPKTRQNLDPDDDVPSIVTGN